MAVIDDIYKVVLTVDGQEITLPQTPEDITISNDDKTRVETLANGEPFTIAQYDGPQTFKFDFVVTRKCYHFTFGEEWEGVRFYTDLLWNIKVARKPIGLTILRNHGQPDTNVSVLLRDYSYVEDSNDLSDYTFSVSFVEYYPQKNHELEGSQIHHLVTAGYATSWKHHKFYTLANGETVYYTGGDPLEVTGDPIEGFDELQASLTPEELEQKHQMELERVREQLREASAELPQGGS